MIWKTYNSHCSHQSTFSVAFSFTEVWYFSLPKAIVTKASFVPENKKKEIIFWCCRKVGIQTIWLLLFALWPKWKTYQSRYLQKSGVFYQSNFSYIIIKEKFWLRMGKFAKTLSLLVQIKYNFIFAHFWSPIILENLVLCICNTKKYETSLLWKNSYNGKISPNLWENCIISPFSIRLHWNATAISPKKSHF